MSGPTPVPRDDPGAALESCFKDEWPALVALAARITSDLARAEEAVQDVLVSALARWPFTGVPERPAAWLRTATRNRALNQLRDTQREAARYASAARLAVGEGDDAGLAVGALDEEDIDDDRLRLMFVCCDPVLSSEAQVALTLRLVGGLSTREIARAFLSPEPTVAQRIVRAKRSIADAGIPFAVPPRDQWPERLPAILGAVYLVFNEGYSAAEGTSPIRRELSGEALRLGRLLVDLLPLEPEARALVALMELHSSRLAARIDDSGNLVLLQDQDRSLWDRDRIAAGISALARSRELSTGEAGPGPLLLQAELAACHATAPTWEDTDWRRIVELYDQLLATSSSAVVQLNRAVAVSMADGPAQGLIELEPLFESGALAEYHLLWATRADFARRLSQMSDAASDYEQALALATNEAERRFLTERIAECRLTPGEAS